MNRPMKNFTAEHIKRFWGRVAKGSLDDCWEWQGFTTGGKHGGYGGITFFNILWTAHRVAYYLHYNIDPGKLQVCHTCDNPKCCNPHHLWLGTDIDNSKDMMSKVAISRVGVKRVHQLNLLRKR